MNVETLVFIFLWFVLHPKYEKYSLIGEQMWVNLWLIFDLVVYDSKHIPKYTHNMPSITTQNLNAKIAMITIHGPSKIDHLD